MLPKVGLGGRFGLVSRESMLLTNNVLLVVACGTVLPARSTRCLIDALNLGKISGRRISTRFHSGHGAGAVPHGVGPFARWKEASIPEIARTVGWALGAAAVVAIVLPFVYGSWTPLVGLGLLLAPGSSSRPLLNFVERAPHPRRMSLLAAAWRQPPFLRHASWPTSASLFFVVGVTMVAASRTKKDVKMEPGDTVGVAGTTFRFNGVRRGRGPNYTAAQGRSWTVGRWQAGAQDEPEKRTYRSSAMP